MIAKLNGTDFFYEEKGTGIPILLIHPAGGSASTWGSVVDGLAAAGRVIAYERRGYSRTGGEPVRSIHQHTADAGALLDALDAKPAVVVGTSVGATIAVDLALRRPDVVRSVVAYESPWRARRHPDVSSLWTVARTWWTARAGRHADAVATFMRWAYAYPEGGSAWDAFPGEWRRIARANARATIADVWIAIGDYPAPTRLATIAAPVICVHGARSTAAMARITRRLAEALPNSRVREVEGAAHSVSFDAPAEFVRLILEEVPELGRRDRPAALGFPSDPFVEGRSTLAETMGTPGN